MPTESARLIGGAANSSGGGGSNPRSWNRDYKAVSQGALRSHLALDGADPDFGARYSVESLRTRSRSTGVPSALHGAPETAEESRFTLDRLRRMAGFESQDFDPADNDVEREAAVHRTEEDYANAEFWRWVLAAAIGATMGALAFGVDWGIDVLNKAKLNLVTQRITSSGGFWAPYLAYIGVGLAYALVAGCLVAFVEPLAGGSGIPEIKTYLNGTRIRGLLTIRTLAAKLLGIVFAIGAGVIAGKEGPFVHGGAVVGGGISGLGSKTLTALAKGRWKVQLPRRWGGYFRNDADHRDFTAIGTAAGVAAAFAAPIGGVLFTIEEGVSFYSTGIFWRGFLATCIAVLTLHFLVEVTEHPTLVMEAHFGRYRDFGLYTDSMAFYGARMFYYLWDVPLFMGMGAIGGLMGAAFCHFNVKVTQLRHRFVPVRNPGRRLAELLLLVLVTGTLWFTVSYAAPCRPLPDKDDLVFLEASEDTAEEFFNGGTEDAPLQHFPRLWCPPGQYSTGGQLFFQPLAQSLRMVMHLGEPLPADRPDFYFDFGVLTAFFGLSFLLMIWTNGVGASTGMFVPALAIGATGGRMFGRGVKLLVQACGSELPVSLPAYSVIGAAAYMGGATRMTLTTTVMVMETTGALMLIVPIMLTVFVAKIVGDRFGVGIDDTHIKLRGAPVLDEAALDAHQAMIADKLNVAELMTPDVTALPPVVPVQQLLDVLRSSNHQAFPVTPEVDAAADSSQPWELHGCILRSTLLRMLARRLGLTAGASSAANSRSNGARRLLFPEPPPARAHVPSSQRERLALLEALEQIPLKLRPKEDQEAVLSCLSPEELAGRMDLRPFMQRHPYVVASDASMSRAYRLFRTMGLRHIFVGPPRPKVVGVVTRKDLVEPNAKLVLGHKASAGLTSPSTDNLVRAESLPFIPYGAYDPTVGREAFSSSGDADGGWGWCDFDAAEFGEGYPAQGDSTAVAAPPTRHRRGLGGGGGGGRSQALDTELAPLVAERPRPDNNPPSPGGGRGAGG